MQTLLLKTARKGQVLSQELVRVLAGNTFKLRGPPQALVTKPVPKGPGGQVSSLGTVTTLGMRG